MTTALSGVSSLTASFDVGICDNLGSDQLESTYQQKTFSGQAGHIFNWVYIHPLECCLTCWALGWSRGESFCK